MAYYTKEIMISELNKCPEYREFLYNRGFFISNRNDLDLNDFPFYGNWTKYSIDNKFLFYVNNCIKIYFLNKDNVTLFLIGHAYNPFRMQFDELDILDTLYNKLSISEQSFWEVESELTGVFCIGFINDNNIIFSTDCAGMQLINYGIINDCFYISSHSKLISDITGITQDEYVTRLVNNKFWHFWGMWLPGDLSPYKELKRLIPNCKCCINLEELSLNVKRYYPSIPIKEVLSKKEYNDIISSLSDIMSRNMELIAKKWPDKKVSISVTGGRDSMTTLACTNGLYDKYNYFSYISNDDESVDAFAAKEILEHINLKHEIIDIPSNDDYFKNIDVFEKVLECNAGCIGENSSNEVRKRLFFCLNPPCDIEVKSWVNEIGRGRCYDRFLMRRFPDHVNASYWRTMHKAYIYDLKLMRDTDRVFDEYLSKYYSSDEFEKLFWVVYYHWEFSWAGGEGIFLTAEHRTSYEITIPFNNRKYLELMLQVPIEKRKVDSIPNDIIIKKNKSIAETGIVINDVSHTKVRALIERIHLELYSRIK